MNAKGKKRSIVPIILIGACLLLLIAGVAVETKDSFINFANGSPQLEVAAQGNKRAKDLFQPIFTQLPSLEGETIYRTESNFAEPPQQTGYKCPCQGTVNRSLEHVVVMQSADDSDFSEITQQFLDAGWIKNTEFSPVISRDDSYRHTSFEGMNGAGGTAHIVKISNREEVERIGLDPRRYMDFGIAPKDKTKLLQHFSRSSKPVYGFTVHLNYNYAEGRLP